MSINVIFIVNTLIFHKFNKVVIVATVKVLHLKKLIALYKNVFVISGFFILFCFFGCVIN